MKDSAVNKSSAKSKALILGIMKVVREKVHLNLYCYYFIRCNYLLFDCNSFPVNETTICTQQSLLVPINLCSLKLSILTAHSKIILTYM